MEGLDYGIEPIDVYLSGRTGNTLSPVRPKTPPPPMELIETIGRKAELKQILKENIIKATEITITFKPQIQYRWLEPTLKMLTETTLRKALKKAPQTSKMLLIGEHSRTGLWHYHGAFWGIPNDIVSRVKRACSRDLGRTEIKMITFPDSYLDYIFKAYNPMAELPEQWKDYTSIGINI